jgi:hypothetical protein
MCNVRAGCLSNYKVVLETCPLDKSNSRGSENNQLRLLHALNLSTNEYQ